MHTVPIGLQIEFDGAIRIASFEGVAVGRYCTEVENVSRFARFQIMNFEYRTVCNRIYLVSLIA